MQSFASSFADSLLPAMQSALQEVFQQVSSTMSQGLRSAVPHHGGGTPPADLVPWPHHCARLPDSALFFFFLFNLCRRAR